MKEYLNNLILQFKQATGVKNVDINSASFINEFSKWIKERRLATPFYSEFIYYLSDRPCIGEKTVEIGKGIYDSIAINTIISMITPYADGIIKPAGSIIKGDFYIDESVPMIITEKDEGIEAFSCNDFNRFITQNPYNHTHLTDWEHLHNNGGNITVGVYGSIYDKDIESKLKLMKDFESKLLSGYVSDYTTDRENYMYVVTSHRKIKQKVLVKHMTKDNTKKQKEATEEESIIIGNYRNRSL